MILRDYFAAKAMQGICAGFLSVADGLDPKFDVIADHSYKIADAMLAEREKTND